MPPQEIGKLDYLVGEVLMGHALRGVGERHYDRIDVEEIRQAVEIYGGYVDKIYRENILLGESYVRQPESARKTVDESTMVSVSYNVRGDTQVAKGGRLSICWQRLRRFNACSPHPIEFAKLTVTIQVVIIRLDMMIQ